MTIDHRQDLSLVPFLVASLLVHAAGIVALSAGGALPFRREELPQVIELAALQPPVPPVRGGQVVDAPPPPTPQENPDAELLAKQSDRVAQETIRPGTPGTPAPAKAKHARLESEKEARLRAETLRLQVKLDALRKRRSALKRQLRRLDEAERLGADTARTDRRGNGGTNDFVEIARPSDETRLNTRAFEESEYYNNFKTTFGVQFRPSDVSLGLRFSGEPLNHPRTVLGLVVNADGTLREVRVLRTSGFSVLDRDALEAASRVFPYDPPPGKLLRGGNALRFAFAIIW